MYFFRLLTPAVMRRLAVTAVFAGSIFSSAAQDLENSLLWKVEGKEIETSYLFGTIHLVSQSDFELKQRVIDALENSETLVLEIDMSDPAAQGKIMQKAPMKGGATLDKLLDQETLGKLDKMLQESIGASAAFMNGWKPFVVSTFLIGRLIDGSPASFEASLAQAAKRREMPVLAFETVEEQMALFDEVSYESQAASLAEMVNDEAKMKKLFAEMVKLYRAEKVNELYALLGEHMEDEEEQVLVKDRNERWVPLFGEMAEDSRLFVAVGAGHLPGEGGLVNLLREAGYKVTAVEE